MSKKRPVKTTLEKTVEVGQHESVSTYADPSHNALFPKQSVPYLFHMTGPDEAEGILITRTLISPRPVISFSATPQNCSQAEKFGVLLIFEAPTVQSHTYPPTVPANVACHSWSDGSYVETHIAKNFGTIKLIAIGQRDETQAVGKQYATVVELSQPIDISF